METNIQNLPANERPREKLLEKGAKHLTDVELLSILLGSGNKKHSVVSLAKQVLGVIDSAPSEELTERIKAQDGIGVAKACVLTAAFEFARRRIRPEGTKIREAKDVIGLVSHLSDRPQEHFVCISLNGAHEVIAVRVVTVGLVNSCQIHPREVLCDAIVDRACAIIIAHNHPSGDLTPSKEDEDITRRMRSAAEIVGIKLLDHVVFGRSGYYSFQEYGRF